MLTNPITFVRIGNHIDSMNMTEMQVDRYNYLSFLASKNFFQISSYLES